MSGKMKWKVALVVTVGTLSTVAGVLYVLRNTTVVTMTDNH